MPIFDLIPFCLNPPLKCQNLLKDSNMQMEVKKKGTSSINLKEHYLHLKRNRLHFICIIYCTWQKFLYQHWLQKGVLSFYQKKGVHSSFYIQTSENPSGWMVQPKMCLKSIFIANEIWTQDLEKGRHTL